MEPRGGFEMGSNRHKPEEIVAKLRQVEVLTTQGQSVAEAVRSIGVTDVTYYCWRQEYSGSEKRSGQGAERSRILNEAASRNW
jgi:transposase